MKKMSSATTWIILFAIIICGSYFFYSSNTTGNAVSYTTFKQMWANNEIQSMNVRDGIVQIKAKNNKQYETYVPETTFNALMQENKNEGTTITFKPPSNNSSWFQIIITVLIMGVGISVLFMLMQQSQGGNKGAMNFGQSRAKMAPPDRKKSYFQRCSWC